jgi:hypothetical protein
MNITGSPFVPGPLPKHSLAPSSGPDALYSGLLECPITDRIQKTIKGGAGFNKSIFTPTLFQCPPSGPSPPPTPSTASWSTIADKTLSCSAAEYRGSLGTKATAADCLAAVKGDAKANYAVWHGESNKVLMQSIVYLQYYPY